MDDHRQSRGDAAAGIDVGVCSDEVAIGMIRQIIQTFVTCAVFFQAFWLRIKLRGNISLVEHEIDSETGPSAQNTKS